MGGILRTVDEESYLDNLENAMTPCRASALHIEVIRNYGNPFGVMLPDPQSIGDLLDFWNLRALGWPIIPVPIQWAQRLS